MQLFRGHRRLVGAAASVVLALAACGGDDDTGTTATPASDAPATDAPSTGAPSTDAPASDLTTPEGSSTTPPAETVAPSGTLRIGTSLALATFDPHGATDYQAVWLYPAYDTLTIQDSTGEPQPNLATSWERTDPNTWRYELRDDVVFHDGSTFDATVVKKNIERAQSLDTLAHAAQLNGISEVVVVDDDTVDLVYAEPTPLSPLELSLAAGIMISGEAIDAGTDLSRAPAGSGGWIWDSEASVEGGVQVYRLNPNYWNPAAQGVETVTVLHIAEAQSRVNALLTGDVDIAGIVPLALQDAVVDGGKSLVSFNAGFYGLLIADRVGRISPELADPLVREAIGLSIDRAGYQQAVDAGRGEPVRWFFPSESPWFNEDYGDTPAPDYERARELLAEAGYPDGISFKLSTFPSVDPSMQAIVQMLAPAGIDVELIQVQGGLTAEVIQGTAVGTLVAGRVQHPQQLWNTYLATGNSHNQTFQSQDMVDLDALMAEAAALDDFDAQKEIYDQVMADVIDRNVLFVFNHNGTTAGVAPNVVGAQMGGGQSEPRPYGIHLD